MRGQIIQYVEDADEPVEKRGASGARLIIGQKYTTKLDVERTGTFVREQGAWLSRWSVERGITLLPRVTEIFATGYVMETVQELENHDITEMCQHVMSALQEQLWPKQVHGHMFLWDNFSSTHRGYVAQLLRDVAADRELGKTLRRFYDRIDWNNLQHGLTHGDPILDNVGYRLKHWPNGSIEITNELVLLDPIPAKDPLPNWRAVDVGRIIQSMVGYEAIRYQRQGADVDFNAAVATALNWYMSKDFNVNEARACVYFSVIHTLRGVRTTTRGTAARLGVWYLVNQLVKVAESWML